LITSLFLSFGFLAVQFLPDERKFLALAIHGLLTIILFVWSLFEGLGINSTLLTLILPFFYTLGVGFFWFLLPSSLLTQILIVIFYGIGIYALCLTMNIYTVSAIRTIALIRAARGVGFILTLFTFFLIFNLILSFKWPLYLNSIFVLILSFPIFLQGFWSIPLENFIKTDLLSLSFVASFALSEIAVAIFFWPVTLVVGSIFLTIASYILLGLGQAYLDQRLFSKTIREYLIVGIAVFLGMLFVTRWGA